MLLFFYCLHVSSQMYQTIQIDNLCKIVLFFDLTVIERISTVDIKFDNAKGTVFWKQSLYLLRDRGKIWIYSTLAIPRPCLWDYTKLVIFVEGSTWIVLLYVIFKTCNMIVCPVTLFSIFKFFLRSLMLSATPFLFLIV